MIMLDVQHRRRPMKMQSDEDNVGWAVDPLYMHYAFWVDESAVSPGKAIELGNIGNISTSSVHVKQPSQTLYKAC